MKPNRAQVTCVNKQPRMDPHEGIRHLGGSGWRWTRSQVIDSIEARTNTFFTMVNGKRAEVGVANGRTGKYFRTHSDGQWNDNLLALHAERVCGHRPVRKRARLAGRGPASGQIRRRPNAKSAPRGPRLLGGQGIPP